ncbi:hypothetical protein AA957_21895 [Pseudomonas trivialis]|uniref:Uncharacterized protein n=1 Tax=Pseudomonas trivialis TaxID=200450 RepID=A0A0H5AGC3_9PSED|nr:hypothetical protein AA957_21895 [Pseudomonas trivialis]
MVGQLVQTLGKLQRSLPEQVGVLTGYPVDGHVTDDARQQHGYRTLVVQRLDRNTLSALLD